MRPSARRSGVDLPRPFGEATPGCDPLAVTPLAVTPLAVTPGPSPGPWRHAVLPAPLMDRRHSQTGRFKNRLGVDPAARRVQQMMHQDQQDREQDDGAALMKCCNPDRHDQK